MRSAVVLEAELKQIADCVSSGFPRLRLRPIQDHPISIVGYGPSLAETWKELKPPVFTVSGAHDFLLDRGIVPDYHAECDGRDHKVRHLERPQEKTTYLMASVCNPKAWELLKNNKVEYWHCAHGQHVVEWIGKNDDGAILVAGGSTVGLSAIHLAGILGYRSFKLYGFDGNLRDGKRHAGEHYGPSQRLIEREGWTTTPQMSNACDELLWLKNENLEIEIVGESLMKSLWH
jgi:hypothetical protein